jgi:polyisoprenoid-binding protein YceI
VRAAKGASALSLALACSALLVGQLDAQSAVDFTVSGTSTIRGWTCMVEGTAEVTTGTGAAVRGFDDGVQAATLTALVAAFECPEEQMRDHLREAMRFEEFPRITFTLESYQPSGQGAVATGTLTILDSSHPVTFPIFLTPSASGVELEGEVSLDMTTYGVEPPVVFGGLLRVRPQIRIQFAGVVSP